jgi:hypothetical protein
MEGFHAPFCLTVRRDAYFLVNHLTNLHRTVPAQFKVIPRETLGLLRSLNSDNRLTATDTKWKHDLGDLIREYLSAWVLNEEWVCHLFQ